MTSRVEELKGEIENLRGEIDEDLDALETRLHRVTDWREQFRKHTAPALGLGLVAGLLTGLGGPGNAFKIVKVAAPLVLAYLLKRERDEHTRPSFKEPPYSAL